MRHGRPTRTRKQKSLKLFVADALLHVRWETVPYSWTCSTEASVIEAVACSWDDACPGGSCSEQAATTVDDEIDVVSQVCRCLARQ